MSRWFDGLVLQSLFMVIVFAFTEFYIQIWWKLGRWKTNAWCFFLFLNVLPNSIMLDLPFLHSWYPTFLLATPACYVWLFCMYVCILLLCKFLCSTFWCRIGRHCIFTNLFWTHKGHFMPTWNIMPLFVTRSFPYPVHLSTVLISIVIWLIHIWVPIGPLPRNAFWPHPDSLNFSFMCSYPYCCLLFNKEAMDPRVIHWGNVTTLTPGKFAQVFLFQLPAKSFCVLPGPRVITPLVAFVLKLLPTVRTSFHTSVVAVFFKSHYHMKKSFWLYVWLDAYSPKFCLPSLFSTAELFVTSDFWVSSGINWLPGDKDHYRRK